jgi:anti-anti-sigma regulatory factor
MVLATSSKAKQLLYVSYIGYVKASDLKRSSDDVKALLAELSPDFRLLADFSQLESMGSDCAAELGELMDLFDQSSVSLVVRVIPDPKKDIGMNILTLFHYRHRPKIVTCSKLSEAARALSL